MNILGVKKSKMELNKHEHMRALWVWTIFYFERVIWGLKIMFSSSEAFEFVPPKNAILIHHSGDWPISQI